MFMHKKLIFTLLLISCIFLSISFVSANNITDDNSNTHICDDSIVGDNQNEFFGNLYNNDLNESENISMIYDIDEVNEEPQVFITGNDSFNLMNTSNNTISKVVDNKIKFTPKIIAKNKLFNKKIKIKNYFVILKNNKSKAMKNKWVTLKVKGKLFKAKTNKNGKAVFKIKKLNKKGNYKAIITFKGDNTYNKVSKKIKIIIK